MTFCDKEDCVNRSKRHSRTFTWKGEKLYKCKIKYLRISPYADGSGDERIIAENGCMCYSFRTIEEG